MFSNNKVFNSFLSLMVSWKSLKWYMTTIETFLRKQLLKVKHIPVLQTNSCQKQIPENYAIKWNDLLFKNNSLKIYECLSL